MDTNSYRPYDDRWQFHRDSILINSVLQAKYEAGLSDKRVQRQDEKDCTKSEKRGRGEFITYKEEFVG